jgi:hypothetical protein
VIYTVAEKPTVTVAELSDNKIGNENIFLIEKHFKKDHSEDRKGNGTITIS